MAINLNIVSKFDDKGIKQINGQLDGVGKTLGKIGGVLAAAFSVKAIADFGKEAILAAEGVATANARIDNIAKSMDIFGQETQAVTDRLIKYAEANEMNLATDAEVIKATQAKLLTFRELALSADEAGGAFDRATQAAVDLAAAGFGAAETNAIQLGKALNDPIKGITALTRSGVTFTKDQKAMIKALVETSEASAAVAVGLFDSEKSYNDFITAQLKAGASGEEITAMFKSELTPAQFELMNQLSSTSDMLGAQDMVLQAIETQVGGTAEATANSSDKMKLAFDNVKETVGAALMPAFEELATTLLPFIEKIGPKVAEAFTVLIPLVVSLADFIINQLVPGLESFFGFISNNIPTVLTFVGVLGSLLLVFNAIRIATAAWAAIQAVLNAVLLLNPLNLVALAVAALVAGIVYLATQTTFFQDTWSTMTTFVTEAWENFSKVFTEIGEAIGSFFVTLVTNISESWETTVNGIKELLDQLGNVFGVVFNAIGSLVKGILNGMIGAFESYVNFVINGVNSIIRALNSIRISIPAFPPFFGGIDIRPVNLPTIPSVRIPRLAEGGIVMPTPGGVLANIAEAGKPEAVIPLDRLGQFGGSTYNITVNAGIGTDPVSLGREVVNAIKRYESVSGKVFATA